MWSISGDLEKKTEFEVFVQDAELALERAARERTRGTGRAELIARDESTLDSAL